MTDDRARLEQLLAEAEQTVAAVKHVLGLLTPTAGNGNGHAPSALEVARARTAITAAPSADMIRTGFANMGATKRTEMAAFLDTFDRTEARPAYGHRRVGAAVRYGYLKPKGEGYVRTAKAFTA